MTSLNLEVKNAFETNRTARIIIRSINKNILGFSNGDPERLSSFFDQELISGSFLSKIMLIIIPIIICRDNKSKFYTFILLGLFSVFITGERTAFYTLLIYLFSILLFIKSEKKKFLVF